ncbi:phage head closure protein [Hansschlegelia beijingensis]
MARITASDLRDRVRLEMREEVDDGWGGVGLGDWVPQFERNACILLSKGGETVIAARLQSVQPALIIVRYDAQTAAITAAWRLIETRSGTVYNIRTVADMERRGRFITMLCEAGVAT